MESAVQKDAVIFHFHEPGTGSDLIVRVKVANSHVIQKDNDALIGAGQSGKINQRWCPRQDLNLHDVTH